jgi:hypothetical protein
MTEPWVAVIAGNLKGIPFYEGMGFVLDHETENLSGGNSFKMICSIKP